MNKNIFRRFKASRKFLMTAVALTTMAGMSIVVSNGAAFSSTTKKIGGSVSIWAEWTSTEQQDFKAVLQPFEDSTGIKVQYTGKGSNMDTALDAAVAGGSPPAVALVPDPGTLDTLAAKHSIKPLSSIVGKETRDYGSAWNKLASYKGKLYGVWFKAANKNTVYYNPAVFKASGITSTPTTYKELLADEATIANGGTYAPVSLCTDIGWPVADLFQNLFLKLNGSVAYDQLATHKMKWSSSDVTNTFAELASLTGPGGSNLLGGMKGALADGSWPDCVSSVFPASGSPTAAMVFEADFTTSSVPSKYAPGNASSCSLSATATPCYDTFNFPAPSGSKYTKDIQGSGDVAMLLKSNRQSKALMKYLASPRAGDIWANLGGFVSPNRKVPLRSYPDPVSKADAKALTSATGFVFSLDDLQVGWEPQLWADMLNVLQNPSASNVTTVEALMDTQATTALGH
ncbi:MAG TPA: ABC transporter substrate-binding protein [Acidimicrobiales bacterium]|nr:ABC transporter substrate-binding protein [Acidimicrobiales bacterium]